MADFDINDTVDKLLGKSTSPQRKEESTVSTASKSDAKSETIGTPTPEDIKASSAPSPSKEDSGKDKATKSNEKPEFPSDSLGIYVVREGDTHADIEKWYGVAKANLPHILRAGQHVRIPLQEGDEILEEVSKKEDKEAAQQKKEDKAEAAAEAKADKAEAKAAEKEANK